MMRALALAGTGSSRRYHQPGPLAPADTGSQPSAQAGASDSLGNVCLVLIRELFISQQLALFKPLAYIIIQRSHYCS